MTLAYTAPDWAQYKMDMHDPHRSLEPVAREAEVVGAALALLVEHGVLPHAQYDEERMLAHRAGVREHFDIPWTAITPRMQRLLYAINAIARPDTVVAVGIFCGNTFISNAGAAIGPGASYQARRLVGLEIRPDEAARARRNVEALAGAGRAEVLPADGLPFLRDFQGTIDLLYLDADGSDGRGKSIYLDLLEAGQHALRPGSLILAHNSVNAGAQLGDYLAYVRDPARFCASANMAVDGEGLEVSMYRGNDRE